MTIIKATDVPSYDSPAFEGALEFQKRNGYWLVYYDQKLQKHVGRWYPTRADAQRAKANGAVVSIYIHNDLKDAVDRHLLTLPKKMTFSAFITYLLVKEMQAQGYDIPDRVFKTQKEDSDGSA